MEQLKRRLKVIGRKIVYAFAAAYCAQQVFDLFRAGILGYLAAALYILLFTFFVSKYFEVSEEIEEETGEEIEDDAEGMKEAWILQLF